LSPEPQNPRGHHIKVNSEFLMPKLDVSRKIPRNRHAGLDPASRTYRNYWIPAFAGMTGKRRKLIFMISSNLKK